MTGGETFRTSGGGYIGITGQTGIMPSGYTYSTPPKPAIVELTKLEMVNHDESHFGEDLGKEWSDNDTFKDVLKDDYNYKDQKEQTNAIVRLKKLLEQHASSF